MKNRTQLKLGEVTDHVRDAEALRCTACSALVRLTDRHDLDGVECVEDLEVEVRDEAGSDDGDARGWALSGGLQGGRKGRSLLRLSRPAI